MREHNLALVMREITRSRVPPSRADIAARTGLTRTTISALVDQLVAAGLATELPQLRVPRAGRPAVPLVPAAGTVAGIGLEINVDYLGVRAVDLTGAVLAEDIRVGDFRGAPADSTLAELSDLFVATIGSTVDQGLPVAGGCVAIPGLVDSGTGPLRLAPNLRWTDLDLVDALAARPAFAGVPLSVANEASLAALAEADALRRAGSSVRSFVYVSGEVGIGGATVVDEVVSPGQHGWSGEIGHTTVDPAGPPCACGSTGCLEQYRRQGCADGRGRVRSQRADRRARGRGRGRIRARLERGPVRR